MLNAEEASARLDALRDPRWRDAAEARARDLPGGWGDVAEAFLPRIRRETPAELAVVSGPTGFLEHVISGHAEFSTDHERLQAAARRLDQASDDERMAVMEALHPGLGRALARWWVDARSRPYRHGWDRRAFRTTGDRPEVTVEARGDDLAELIDSLGPFYADPAWLAGWAGHLGMDEWRYGGSDAPIGGLLASAIDLGGPAGEETLATLLAVGNGEHPTGIMGRPVIVALLAASRPEGWQFVERLLLAAQRQEGLRQSILEAADEGHPEAFDRILAVVLDRKLLRFAAAVRAAGVWLGFGADVSEIPQVEAKVRALAEFRSDERRRTAALTEAGPWDAYIALCARGLRDVFATLPEAARLASDPVPDRRAAALRYLAETELPGAQEIIAPALGDEDLRVAALAAELLEAIDGLGWPGTFDLLVTLIPRLPEKGTAVDGLGVEQVPVTLDRARVASLLVRARAGRPLADLLPWLRVMDVDGRCEVASEVAQASAREPGLRPVLFELLGDRSSTVREVALAALARTKVTEAEAPAVEGLLTRSASDVRRGALILLQSLPEEVARASAERLSASKNKNQRDAGAELSRALDSSRGRPPRGEAEAPPPEPETGPAAAGWWLPGSMGELLRPANPVGVDLRETLISPERRSSPVVPSAARGPGGFSDEAALTTVSALDDLAHSHRNTQVSVTSWQGSDELLLGDIDWLPSPFGRRWDGDEDGASGGLVLPEVFRAWWDARPAGPRRDDGLDALRGYVTWALDGPAGRGPGRLSWWHENLRDLAGRPTLRLRHSDLVGHVLAWLVAERATTSVVDECLDAFETSLAMVPADALRPDRNAPPRMPGLVIFYDTDEPAWDDWRTGLDAHPWHDVLGGLHRTRPELFGRQPIARWYGLMRWVEQPDPAAKAVPVDLRLLTAAYEAGVASRDDVVAAFLRPRCALFTDLTRRWRAQAQARHPALAQIADEVRDRLIEVELSRGDLPTPTSGTVVNVGSVVGASTVADLLRALGRTALSRGYIGYSDSRPEVLSQLIRVSFPGPDETGANLSAAAHAAGVPDARLVDLAVYAPQWAALVQDALGWPGLADAALWLHAHTKDDRWDIDDEIRESWAAMTAERTPLSADDLMAGAVDVEWFSRGFGVLGPDRWAALDKAAKYASGGNGHIRARMFAAAMLGRTGESELTAQITGKRHQDAARALGLVPLPEDRAGRTAAIQRRYAVLREFERGSSKFGSQRQASERTAARIGVENLARTAGFADTQRFVWSAEAREAGDLARGEVTVTRGDVDLTLSVDPDGMPALVIRRAGRVLAAVPSALRKDQAVADLRARKTALTRQASRVRQALEAAMVARDPFTDGDLGELTGHPIVRPMLERLLWVDEAGQVMGRPGGQTTSADGSAVTARGPLRIAHPVDFVAEGTWVRWQEQMFRQEWRQPFKQAFRELYVPTAAELDQSPQSRRYEGQQVQPRQALALLGTRGWLASRDTGDVSRVFHQHRLIARVDFADGFLTPAEADLPTIGGVYFTRPGEYLAQPLGDVPPVVFSEVMRDLDLVVSVAHAGGVDPETTASTTQMRAALIRETARLLKLENIDFAGDHLLIDGALGEYSLHLGSGTVHRRPGGAVCIIPVGSQHRGRLFLPFADDDPKTAEIVSKALLLARDHEIRDPTILEQLRS